MSKQIYFDAMKEKGKLDAADFQSRAVEMTGTEMCAEEEKIPSFKAAVALKNMLDRKAGQEDGFVCKSTAGRVVRLIQNYDSTVHTQEPEELLAQWRFKWSTDPKKARPFISLATSPYAIGDCCTHEGHVWRSGQDNNTWAPGTVNIDWEDLGPIEEVQVAG